MIFDWSKQQHIQWYDQHGKRNWKLILWSFLGWKCISRCSLFQKWNNQKYFFESININCNGWIGLKWDYAHQIDRAESDAKSSTAVESHLSLAKKWLKLFRYGKEIVWVFHQINVTCISLNDEIKTILKGKRCHIFQLTKSYQPVVQPNIKFAAYDINFKNY